MPAARDQPNKLLFRIAFARTRPAYCYGCICLTPDERRYQRRVFRLTRRWHRMLKGQSRSAASGQG
jgi:hypothetical protein